MSKVVDYYLSPGSPWTYLGHARLAELKRWRDYLGIPLVIQPKFFPVNTAPAAELICGAPTYVYRNELFWGQDRLEFLERALAR